MSTTKKIETTQLNQGLGVPGLFSAFTSRVATMLQILALVVGVPSSVCGIINILLITNLHKNHFKFRHTILTIVFTVDFLKCVLFTIYTILQISHYNIFDEPVAYNTLGYFTHIMLTSADAMALFLTWHFAVLIFLPNWRVYSKKTNSYEGGLFSFRYYIYGITIFYSFLVSSLVLININTPIDLSSENVTISKTKGLIKLTHTSKLGGYKPYATIISVPQTPFYYSLFFSWLFRYVALLSILVVFLAIYLSYVMQTMKIRKRLKNLSNDSNDSENQIDIIRLEFSDMVITEFNKNRQKFKKQLNTIFLYPLSYFLLWLVPLVENVEQKFHDLRHGPILPITIIVALCHPANCLFDLLIFFIIEKPLKFSWANYQKDLIINNYLKPQDKSTLSIEDKYFLTNKTKLGRLNWYSSKEVSRLIEQGDIIQAEEDKVKIPLGTRFLNFYSHMLPFRKIIDLDELYYVDNKPLKRTKSQHFEELDNPNLSPSARSFNIDNDSNPDKLPQDDWVVNILKERNLQCNKNEQFKNILDGVNLADTDIELESTFTVNEDMDIQSDKVSKEGPGKTSENKNINITDFLNG